MKHRTKSALPCDLKRQRSGDRLNRQAKPNQRNHHRRRVVCSDHHTGALCLSSIFRLQPSTLSLYPHSRSACSGYLVEFDLRACLNSSPGGEDQDEGVRSFHIHKTPDFLRDFYRPVRLGLFYFCFNSASTAETIAE